MLVSLWSPLKSPHLYVLFPQVKGSQSSIRMHASESPDSSSSMYVPRVKFKLPRGNWPLKAANWPLPMDPGPDDGGRMVAIGPERLTSTFGSSLIYTFRTAFGPAQNRYKKATVTSSSPARANAPLADTEVAG